MQMRRAITLLSGPGRHKVSVRPTAPPGWPRLGAGSEPLLAGTPLLPAQFGDVPTVFRMRLEPVIGEQGVEVCGRGDGGGQAGEDVAEVGEGLDLVRFAGGDQAEEDRGAVAPRFAGHEEPVLPVMLSSALSELCEVQDYVDCCTLRHAAVRELPGLPGPFARMHFT